jgi:hypothetical protein
VKGHSHVRYNVRRALPLLVALTAPLTSCSRAEQKNFTWSDRLPSSDCQPRTQQAREKVGFCPNLADPQRPAPHEVREFAYMNRKQEIEGTVVPEGLEGPGCLQWRVNARTGQPERHTTGKKQGCISVEDAIKNFKLP